MRTGYAITYKAMPLKLIDEIKAITLYIHKQNERELRMKFKDVIEYEFNTFHEATMGQVNIRKAVQIDLNHALYRKMPPSVVESIALEQTEPKLQDFLTNMFYGSIIKRIENIQAYIRSCHPAALQFLLEMSKVNDQLAHLKRDLETGSIDLIGLPGTSEGADSDG